MFSRIPLSTISMAAGGILVSVAAAAGSHGDTSATAVESTPLPELTVAPPTDYRDVRLFNEYAFSSQAAFDTTNPKRLVVAIWSGTGCYVKRSADGGKTWGALVPLPQLAGAECSHEPAVTYVSGVGRLYAAYAYTKPDLYLSGVAFSVSADQGATWSTPTSALPELNLGYDEDYGDVRLAAAPFKNHWHGRNLYFSRSADRGSSWSPSKMIAEGNSTDGTSLSGFSLAAGRGGNVLVAYGLGQYLDTGQSYTVEVARSADHGASFLYGTADQSDGYSYPDPDIKVGPMGTAHLVYAKGENPGAAVLYKYSYAPYSAWSAEPVRLDDGLAQTKVRAPRLAVGACGEASVLHATWLESDAPDYWPERILYARKVAQRGYAWSEPLKVAMNVFSNGLAAAGPKAFSIFGRRTGLNQSGILGSRISSGVTCP
jgi:hypothetical protein